LSNGTGTSSVNQEPSSNTNTTNNSTANESNSNDNSVPNSTTSISTNKNVTLIKLPTINDLMVTSSFGMISPQINANIQNQNIVNYNPMSMDFLSSSFSPNMPYPFPLTINNIQNSWLIATQPNSFIDPISSSSLSPPSLAAMSSILANSQLPNIPTFQPQQAL
jgi:hypothetical protein